MEYTLKSTQDLSAAGITSMIIGEDPIYLCRSKNMHKVMKSDMERWFYDAGAVSQDLVTGEPKSISCCNCEY